jgi:hypothetical protein
MCHDLFQILNFNLLFRSLGLQNWRDMIYFYRVPFDSDGQGDRIFIIARLSRLRLPNGRRLIRGGSDAYILGEKHLLRRDAITIARVGASFHHVQIFVNHILFIQLGWRLLELGGLGPFGHDSL